MNELELQTAMLTCDQEMLEYFMPLLNQLCEGTENPESLLNVHVEPVKATVTITRPDRTQFVITVEKRKVIDGG